MVAAHAALGVGGYPATAGQHAGLVVFVDFAVAVGADVPGFEAGFIGAPFDAVLGFRPAPFQRLEGLAVRAGDVVATLVGFGIAALDQAFSGHSRRADKQTLGAGEGFGAALG